MTAAAIETGNETAGQGPVGIHDAIRKSRMYYGEHAEAIDTLVEDVDNLPELVHRQTGATVLEIVHKVADRKPVVIDPKTAISIARTLQATGSQAAAKFMASVADTANGPYVSYAGEEPGHIIRPDIAISGFMKADKPERPN